MSAMYLHAQTYMYKVKELQLQTELNLTLQMLDLISVFGWSQTAKKYKDINYH